MAAMDLGVPPPPTLADALAAFEDARFEGEEETACAFYSIVMLLSGHRAVYTRRAANRHHFSEAEAVTEAEQLKYYLSSPGYLAHNHSRRRALSALLRAVFDDA